MASVKIGPEFFANTKRDYNDWRFAFVRELAQNSIDCGSKTIDVRIDYDGTDTIVTWENDGAPMDEDILVNKFLCMGGTGKNFNNAVGGFGLAKQLIAFCHKSYEIRSGDCVVNGVGGEYELTNGDFFCGTRTRVVMEGNVTNELIKACKMFTSLSQWDGKFTVNGEDMPCALKKGAFRTELPLGKIYTNNSHSNIVVVRMRGILMHTRYTTLDKCVVVELGEPSCDYLQSSRDHLNYKHSNELDVFISDLTVNKRALDQKPVETTVYSGSTLGQAVAEPQVLSANIVLTGAEVAEAVASGEVVRDVSYEIGYQFYSDATLQRVISRMAKSVLDYGFVIHNESGMEVPAHYLPSSDKFGSYARKLATIWSGMLLTLHTVCNVRDEFLVGFVFDDRNADGDVTEALFSETNGVKTYFINPVEIVRQRHSNSRSMKNKYKLTDFGAFVSLAAHEFVHGAYNCGYHDETYAGKLTDTMGVVLNNIKLFRGCM